MPERIQQRRTKGWRMPANTVSVARPHRWGNPFRIVEPITREDAVRMFRELVLDREAFIVTDPGTRWEVRNRFRDPVGRRPAPTLDEIRSELAGKNLACFCALDQPCHADVLLELANGGRLELAPEPTEDAFGITHGVTVEQAVGLAASLVQTLNEAVPTIRRLESVIEQKAIEENR